MSATTTQLVSFTQRPPPTLPPPPAKPYAAADFADAQPGVMVGDDVYPLPFMSMLDVIDAAGFGGFKRDWLDDALRQAPLKANRVTLLSPIPNPPTVICIGKNYQEHIKEVDTQMPGIAKDAVPPVPIIFTKSTSSVCGPDNAVAHPSPASSKMDYEGELGVVIGVGGKDIPKEDAGKHVFGYTIVNDLTARDVQKAHQQWFLGKSFDGFSPIGPCIIPKAELSGGAADPRALSIVTRVNGEVRQTGSTSDMIRDVGDLVECISSCVTLRPGDVLVTGTPAGVGAGFDPPKFLKPRDVVEVEVEGIGTLRTYVAPSLSSKL